MKRWTVLAFLAIVVFSARTSSAAVDPVEKRTYDLRPIDNRAVIDVGIPLMPLDKDETITSRVVLRVTGPAGDQPLTAVTFGGDPTSLIAKFTAAEVARPGAYTVAVLVTTTKPSPTPPPALTLTFNRPAPKLALSPLVFDCEGMGDTCAPSPNEVTVSESDGLHASNLEVRMNTLSGPDGAAGGELVVAPLGSLPPRGSAKLQVTTKGAFDLGKTTGTAVLHSDQTADVSVPFEIRRHRPKWLLLIVLGIGFAIGAFQRFVVKRRLDLRAAREAAWDLADDYRNEARLTASADLRNAFLELAAKLEVLATATRVADIQSGCKLIAAERDRNVASYTKEREAQRQRLQTQLSALAGADLLPRDLRTVALAVEARVRAQLKTDETIANDELERTALGNDRALADLRRDISRWAATVERLKDVEDWTGTSLAESKTTIRASLEASRKAATEQQIAAASALAEAVRYHFLGVTLGEIWDVGNRATELLRKLKSERIEEINRRMIALRLLVGEDAQLLERGMLAANDLRSALVSALEASITGANRTDAIKDALATGNFGALPKLVDELAGAKPKGLLGAAEALHAAHLAPDERPDDVPGIRSAVPVTASASAGPTEKGRSIRTFEWSMPYSYVVSAFVLGAGGYFALEQTFLGTGKDILLALFWSIGAHVTASSFDTLKPMLPASLPSAPEPKK